MAVFNFAGGKGVLWLTEVHDSASFKHVQPPSHMVRRLQNTAIQPDFIPCLPPPSTI